ncbi:MAG: ATP-binding cassette subfamily F protein uup [Planctomycetota bacterium]|jgi:ATP-binding cassette subfamily F protein uup
MALINIKDLKHAFGGPTLLDQIDLRIEPGERIGLIGRNGSGKSTLMKILAGDLVPDSGEISRQQGLRMSVLRQEVPSDLKGTVAEFLRESVGEFGEYVDWEVEENIEVQMRDLGLNGDDVAQSLSAGKKRRLLLAAALIVSPDLLLLDEPTNHLDIGAIGRLEKQLSRYSGSVLFVTHDRTFMSRISTRIIDLDRGALRNYTCDYATYLTRKDAELEVEKTERATFDKKLAKEEAWIRRGVQGRRARNMGRVNALGELREKRQSRRDRSGSVKAKIHSGGSSGRLVLKATDLSHAYDGAPVIKDFETTIMRGDRVGIIGPNGAGKTTLIKILLGELTPTTGEVHHGTKLDVAHFDQLHGQLDPSLTMIENVGGGSNMITVNGESRHIIGYLGDFLFTPEQVRGSITKLSGGERNRLQLARILAKPCNLLILDEPTNDLDIETLEILEELLFNFDGTILIVSHDREFLNNVVTSTIVFEGDGTLKEFDGGYDDWVRQAKKKGADKTVAWTKSGKSKPKRKRA